MQLKPSISLRLGTNFGFGKRVIVEKTVGQNILFPLSYGDPLQKWPCNTDVGIELGVFGSLLLQQERPYETEVPWIAFYNY